MKSIETIERIENFKSDFYDHQHGIRKIYQLSDGNLIETSLYKHYSNGAPADISIDISTMVGCPMKCVFCASSSLSYTRQLTSEEIIDQVKSILLGHDDKSFGKIVFSFQGIGEPSLIPDKISECGLSLLEMDDRSVLSIATMAINLRGIRSWRKDKLPIASLQFSSPGIRSSVLDYLVPHRPSFADIVEEIFLCADADSITSVNLNYILIDGLNDTAEDVCGISEIFKDTGVRVKISSLNLTDNVKMHNMRASSLEKAKLFDKKLKENGVKSSVFGAYGKTNISCGQLVHGRKAIA